MQLNPFSALRWQKMSTQVERSQAQTVPLPALRAQVRRKRSLHEKGGFQCIYVCTYVLSASPFTEGLHRTRQG